MKSDGYLDGYHSASSTGLHGANEGLDGNACFSGCSIPLRDHCPGAGCLVVITSKPNDLESICGAVARGF